MKHRTKPGTLQRTKGMTARYMIRFGHYSRPLPAVNSFAVGGSFSCAIDGTSGSKNTSNLALTSVPTANIHAKVSHQSRVPSSAATRPLPVLVDIGPEMHFCQSWQTLAESTWISSATLSTNLRDGELQPWCPRNTNGKTAQETHKSTKVSLKTAHRRVVIKTGCTIISQ